MKHRNKKGFTLGELLIVVAIIAVLVAIGIAVFAGQTEKARRAVDMQNARAIQSALTNAYSTGDLSMTSNDTAGKIGIWVLMCRDGSSEPSGYGSYQLRYNNTLFCGADASAIIKGSPSGTVTQYKEGIEEILKEYGIKTDSLKIKCSKDNEKQNGWDWIVIQVDMDKNGTIQSHMYSGFAGESSSVNWYNKAQDNLGKLIYGN